MLSLIHRYKISSLVFCNLPCAALFLSNNCCFSYWPWTHKFKHLVQHLCNIYTVERFYWIKYFGVTEGDSINWADSAAQVQHIIIIITIITTLFHSNTNESCTTPYSTLVVFMRTHISSPSVYVQDIKDIPILFLASIINIGKVSKYKFGVRAAIIVIFTFSDMFDDVLQPNPCPVMVLT